VLTRLIRLLGDVRLLVLTRLTRLDGHAGNGGGVAPCAA
jgi:hypothetical protein